MSQALTQSSAALLSAPATRLRAVTPSDSVALPLGACKAFMVGTAGNVAVIAEDDNLVGATPVVLAVTAGQVVPVRAAYIYSAGTTATGIVALY